jgi:hypothetical protein
MIRSPAKKDFLDRHAHCTGAVECREKIPGSPGCISFNDQRDDKKGVKYEFDESSLRALMRSDVSFFFDRMDSKLSFFSMVTRIRSPSRNWILPTGLRTLSHKCIQLPCPSVHLVCALGYRKGIIVGLCTVTYWPVLAGRGNCRIPWFRKGLHMPASLRKSTLAEIPPYFLSALPSSYIPPRPNKNQTQ